MLERCLSCETEVPASTGTSQAGMSVRQADPHKLSVEVDGV